MSRQDRDSRGRDSRSAAAAGAGPRTNEYFVPKDGIDREVITADICRYLGNDALVRPGTYEDRQTGTARPGYFITAYRNLTTAMIADLKADSERWENERRATATRGQPSNVGYRDSTTHQSRQYYGPTEPTSGPPQGFSTGASSQVGYDNGQSYQSQPSYAHPGPSYNQQPTYAVASDNYYVAGANLVPEESMSRARVPVQSTVSVPRTQVSNVQYAGATQYQQPPEPRGNYYPSQAGPPVSSAPTYSTQVTQDPYYGRDQIYAQDSYESRPSYQENASYVPSQPPVSQPSPAVASNTGSRRSDRERDHDSRDARRRRN